MTNSRIKPTLSNWFYNHPAISVRMIEVEAGIPSTSLHKFLAGQRPLPIKYQKKLIEVLNKYGYKK